jgi:UDP-N-acetylmuramyl pentapeptide phosphotransferase/UDP-N-acetylglucosamine-1-phosphate transferase
MQILLGAVLIAFFTSAFICFIFLILFPRFRSGEHKEGHFRADQSSGDMRVEVAKGGKIEVRAANSHELPLVGGVAMILAIVAASVATGLIVDLSMGEWKLLGSLLLALVGFGLVGFMDDWMKVRRGVGISELQKFIGVFVIALASALEINRSDLPKALSAKLAYPPYSDIPGLGHLLVDTKFAWIAFFVLMTVAVVTTTSLAVDFADGMDGLGGGLMLSAALSFAAIILGEGFQDLWPAAIAMLAIAGACAGFLPFNWPSSWKAKAPGGAKRRARIIMGDTGSLALGGLLGLVAVVSRLEFVLLFVGGIFVLEGLSALISARILVRFFRKFLYLERFQSSRGFSHTEFPLPFLATPMHHHYDLLNWDRKRIVYGAWTLGAGLGLLGVASTIAPLTWERYLARFIAFLMLVAIWQAGAYTKGFFIGLARPVGAAADAPRRLTLCYGFPFKLIGWRLYRRIDTTAIGEEALMTPAERLTLWQRMSVFDARSLLGFYCYRAEDFDDAQRIWGRLPKLNLEKRPEIAELYVEVRHEQALRTDGKAGSLPYDLQTGAFGIPRDPDAPVRRSLVTAADEAATAYFPTPPPASERELSDGAGLDAARPPVVGSAPMWSASAYTDWALSASGIMPVPSPEAVESLTKCSDSSSPQIATIEPLAAPATAGDDEDTKPGTAVPSA